MSKKKHSSDTPFLWASSFKFVECSTIYYSVRLRMYSSDVKCPLLNDLQCPLDITCGEFISDVSEKASLVHYRPLLITRSVKTSSRGHHLNKTDGNTIQIPGARISINWTGYLNHSRCGHRYWRLLGTPMVVFHS